MEEKSSQILHFHVTCVAETEGNSNLMEKQGLIKVRGKLDACNVAIESLTTDRHSQIRKHLLENSSIRNQFDIWHAKKSLWGKLTKAAKFKANSELKPWIKSIENHFWCCCKTCHGNIVIFTISQKMRFLLFVSMDLLAGSGYLQTHQHE